MEHRVNLALLAIRRINSVSYRARTEKRNFERSENQKMLGMNVIEPAQTKLTSSVVLEP